MRVDWWGDGSLGKKQLMCKHENVHASRTDVKSCVWLCMPVTLFMVTLEAETGVCLEA